MFLKNVYSNLILIFASISQLSLYPLESFEIHHQLNTEKLGYGNCNSLTNGELTLIKHILKIGDVVFDVGANRGEWSRLALEKESRIQLFSFEPIPEVFEILKMNFLSLSNVKTFACAMSNEVGGATFYHYVQDPEKSGFYDREVLRPFLIAPQALSVSLETVDHFCSVHGVTKIDFLKIDTEGAEWKVLTGAKNLLKHHQIRAIQFEYGGCYIDSKTSLRQVMEFLTDNQYVIFRIIPEGLIHISYWNHSLENFDYSNYFAICQEDMPHHNLVKF